MTGDVATSAAERISRIIGGMAGKSRHRKPATCLPKPEEPTDATAVGDVPPEQPGEPPPFFAWSEERYFQLYLMQRKSFSDARKDAFLRFDQTIVTVAVGAIALSVAFLEKQPISAELLLPLFVSWGACILAVIAILSSLLTASKADSAQIRSLDECMRTGVVDNKAAKRWNRSTYWLNSLGIFFCVVGLVALTLFGVWNLERKGGQEVANPKDSSKQEQPKPVTPSRERYGDLSEERRIPATQRIDKAAPSEDIAGPFNKDNTKK